MVVSNTSPLVYLAALDDFELLHKLFSSVVVPQSVFEEITIGGKGLPVDLAFRQALTSWLSVLPIADIGAADRLQDDGLHPGESEAIVLAAERQAPALLMDDAHGVRAATEWKLNIIRTPGIYRLAKARGIIPAVRPKLDELRRVGLWLREDPYRIILDSLGE